MKKSTKIIYSYLITFLLALIFLKVFKEFYIWWFNPPRFSSIFSLWDINFELSFTGFIYSFIFFLPLVIFIVIERKKLLIWSIGIFIPFLLIFAGGVKEIIWVVIFTIAGSLIGWLIKFAIKKLKKNLKILSILPI